MGEEFVEFPRQISVRQDIGSIQSEIFDFILCFMEDGTYECSQIQFAIDFIPRRRSCKKMVANIRVDGGIC